MTTATQVVVTAVFPPLVLDPHAKRGMRLEFEPGPISRLRSATAAMSAFMKGGTVVWRPEGGQPIMLRHW